MPKYKVGQRFTHKSCNGWIATITSVDELGNDYYINWKFVDRTALNNLGSTDETNNSHYIVSVDEDTENLWTPCGTSLELFVEEKLRKHGYA